MTAPVTATPRAYVILSGAQQSLVEELVGRTERGLDAQTATAYVAFSAHYSIPPSRILDGLYQDSQIPPLLEVDDSASERIWTAMVYGTDDFFDPVLSIPAPAVAGAVADPGAADVYALVSVLEDVGYAEIVGLATRRDVEKVESTYDAEARTFARVLPEAMLKRPRATKRGALTSMLGSLDADRGRRLVAALDSRVRGSLF